MKHGNKFLLLQQWRVGTQQHGLLHRLIQMVFHSEAELSAEAHLDICSADAQRGRSSASFSWQQVPCCCCCCCCDRGPASNLPVGQTASIGPIW